MNKDNLPKIARRILNTISSKDIPSDLILCGGSAITLHLGHRQSEDLDFITTKSQIEKESIKIWLENLGLNYRLSTSESDISDFENDGLDLLLYQQDFDIEGCGVTVLSDKDSAELLSLASMGKLGTISVPDLFTLGQFSFFQFHVIMSIIPFYDIESRCFGMS